MKIVKLLLTVITITLLVLSTPLPILGDEISDKLNDIQKQINELQQQLNNAKSQEKTLKTQLAYIDTQNKITQLKAEETNTQIEKLEKEITDLSSRIVRLSGTVDSITEVLLSRIIQTYKYGNVTPIDLLFSSHGFSDLLNRVKYIQVAQANDKKVLYQLQATKAAYNDQKNDKETRQAQQEKLKKDLEQYRTQLDQQKKQKDRLLEETQNNEAIYQARIIAAQQEAAAILAILNGKGNEVSDGPIHNNNIVGHMISGRSPCSGGTHLHFEVHQNNSIQDPNNYLASTSFTYMDNDGGKDEGAISPHGSWSDWPIFAPIYISQGYGMTPYASGTLDGIKHYSGGPHTGIDMYNSLGDLSVKAVHDGTKYTGQLTGVCSGGALHYIKIDHGDGISTYYLHVL